MPQSSIPANDISWISWFIGLATSAAIFFLAWGIRDVKARFDKVPELELKLELIRQAVERIERELNGKTR